jgi:hypothetical protein
MTIAISLLLWVGIGTGVGILLGKYLKLATRSPEDGRATAPTEFFIVEHC